jgi:nicotinamidase-related amidase
MAPRPQKPKTTRQQSDLHGNAPDSSPVALLVIDMINDFTYPGGKKLLVSAQRAARRIAALKRRAKRARVPVIYVNDNFGRWQSNFDRVLDHVIDDRTPGREIAELLRPDPDDYFVLKPKHSGFYSTTLDILLDYLRARTLVLTGLAGDNCVLFTANDAYLRDYGLFIPSDCVASIEPAENRHALRQMQRILKAEIGSSATLDFARLKRASRR